MASEHNNDCEKTINHIVYELNKITSEKLPGRPDRLAAQDTSSKLLYDIQVEMAYLFDKIKRGPIHKQHRVIGRCYYIIEEISNGNFYPFKPKEYRESVN